MLALSVEPETSASIRINPALGRKPWPLRKFRVLPPLPKKLEGEVARSHLDRLPVTLLPTRAVEQHLVGEDVVGFVGFRLADQDPVRRVAGLDLVHRQSLAHGGPP